MLATAIALAVHMQVVGHDAIRLADLPSIAPTARAAEIRKRLVAAISKDGTVQPHEKVSYKTVAGSPVLMIGAVPIVSVTPLDAKVCKASPEATAHLWGDTLDSALATLEPGEAVPDEVVTARLTTGEELALAPPAPAAKAEPETIALHDGQFTASIRGGIVTLTGKAGSLAEKLAVEEEVLKIQGIADIVNHISVEASTQISDNDLATAIAYPAN